MKGQQIKIVENEVNNGYYVNKENHETRYRDNFVIQGERNEKQQKRRIRIIIMKNKITLDANHKIHRMIHNFNRDTLMAIQVIFTIIG